jgi:hypothetical protein
MTRINTFITALLLTTSLTPTVSVAQAPPANLPYHTVYGRLGAAPGDTGPGQPIPFATLSNLLVSNLGLGRRISLLGTQTFYVNGDPANPQTCGTSGQFSGANACVAGLDTNNCLTPATACLTVQHVVNLIIGGYDLAGFTATISLAHGSSNNYAFTCTAGPVIGQSVFGIAGDSNAKTAVTIVGPALNPAAQIKDGCTASLTNLAFADSASHNTTQFIIAGVGGYGHVDVLNVTFGAMGIGTAISASYGGSITLNGANSLTGSVNAFASVSAGGAIDIGGTVAGSAGITWGTGAVIIQNGGSIVDVTPSTFTGFSGVSGPRCYVSTLTSPDGYNPNQLYPGSSDCVVDVQIGAIGLQTGSGGSSSLDYGTAGKPLLSGGGANAKDTWGTLGVGGGGTGQTTVPGIQSIVAPGQIYYTLTGVNFNSATTDFAIPLTNFPSGMTRFRVSNVIISNASHTLVTATAGAFATTGGSGTIAADQALTVSATTDATNNNGQQLTLTNSTTTMYVLANLAHTPNLYFRIGTPEGATATADVTAVIIPLP